MTPERPQTLYGGPRGPTVCVKVNSDLDINSSDCPEPRCCCTRLCFSTLGELRTSHFLPLPLPPPSSLSPSPPSFPNRHLDCRVSKFACVHSVVGRPTLRTCVSTLCGRLLEEFHQVALVFRPHSKQNETQQRERLRTRESERADRN